MRDTRRPAERLSSSEPDRADYQRDLAVSFERMARLSEGEEAARYLTDAVAIRRRVLALAPDQAVLVQELGLSLVQHFRATEHQPSLVEAAVLLVSLRRRNALEARYHALADQLVPVAEEVEARMRAAEPGEAPAGQEE